METIGRTFEIVERLLESHGITQILLREWLNGSLLPLTLSALLLTSVVLAQTWREFGTGWSRRPGMGVSCSLWWIFLADFIRASFVWTTLWFENDGMSSDFLDPYRSLGFFLAGIFAVFGFLRYIHIFTPRRWGHLGWIASVLITAGFVVITHTN